MGIFGTSMAQEIAANSAAANSAFGLADAPYMMGIAPSLQPTGILGGASIGGLATGVLAGFGAGSLAGGLIQRALGKTGPGPMIGAGAGAAAGAAIGSAFFGIGAIPGAVIGGLIGGFGELV